MDPDADQRLDQRRFEVVELSSTAEGINPVPSAFAIELVDGTTRTTQRWEDGRLVSWTRDQDSAVISRILGPQGWTGALLGDDHPISHTVVYDSLGTRWAIPPTAAELRRTSSQERLPGLSLRARVTLDGFPFAAKQLDYAFRDGLLAANLLEDEPFQTPLPSVSLKLPYLLGVGFLLGDVPFRDVAAGSVVDDDPMTLGCLVGLLAPPVRAASWQIGLDAVRISLNSLTASAGLALRLTPAKP